MLSAPFIRWPLRGSLVRGSLLLMAFSEPSGESFRAWCGAGLVRFVMLEVPGNKKPSQPIGLARVARCLLPKVR